MSGVIFNGEEMNKNENINDYIDRVINKMEKQQNDDTKTLLYEDEKNKIYISKKNLKEHKAITNRIKNKNTLDVSDIDSTDDSSTEDETDTSDDESETSDDDLSDDGIPREFKYLYKKVILGTYDCEMEEHDDAVRFFNNKYGTFEQGSNGSKGHYWTHGETKYNLFKLPKLRSLYDRRINKVSLYNIKIHISFLDCEEEEKKEKQEMKNVLMNFRAQRNIDRHIQLRNTKHYTTLMSHNDIELKRDYNYSKPTLKHKFKIGDVLYSNKNPYLQYVCFWQVVKITNTRLKCKALKPILTLQYKSSNNYTYLMKYVKDDFINEDVKNKYFDKQEHHIYYDFSEYVYRVFNN